MKANGRYEGKYFSIMGDSISTLAGYNPPDYAVFYEWENKCRAGIFLPEDTWWGCVIRELGGQLLANNSYSGSLVCKHPRCEIESYGCSDARTGGLHVGDLKPDVVMILLGINDWGNGMRIAPIGDRDERAVFSTAYEIMLKKIKTNYPGAEIWCLTLPKSCWSQYPAMRIARTQFGQHMDEFSQEIRTCGKAAGARIVEISAEGRPYDTIDGVHPTAEGMRVIADSVLEEVEKWSRE